MTIGDSEWEIYSNKDLSPKDREQVAYHIQSAMEDEASLTLQSSSQFDLERFVRRIVEQIRQEERDKQNDGHQWLVQHEYHLDYQGTEEWPRLGCCKQIP